MIPASSYQYIYLLIVSLFTFVLLNGKRAPTERESILSSFLLCLFLSIFIGFRPVDGIYFVDMINYHDYWVISAKWDGFDYKTDNILFDNLMNFMADGIKVSETFFFTFIAFLYFFGIFFACRKLFPNHTLLAFIIYLSAFSTYSYATNGIKAGAAASLFLLAMAYRKERLLSVLFLLLSWGFHHSMQLPVAAFILTLSFRQKEWYFYGWCICLLVSIAHITFFQNLFAGMSDESGSNYLSTDNYDTQWGGRTGFRIDFVIYSAMPVIMGFFVKYVYKLKDSLYDSLLYMYLTTNGVWMLCMYASFTNRIAYLSWFMYPIVLFYPCFAITNMKHPLVTNRNKFILLHLGFTLFMMIIYY